MIQDIKQNINKIDNDLKKVFENVYITEKTDRGNFLISITANKMFLFEGCKKRIEVKVDINKSDLSKPIIKWNYSLNPLNEKAEKIEKISYLNNIANEIYDIAANRRMVNEYFNSLESHVDLINESVNTEVIKTTKEIILDAITKYVKESHTIIDETYITFVAEKIKMSDKFNIEKHLLESGSAEYVSFDGNAIKIKLK
jgi:hypothetical protein